jgi:gliding motility-associated lipoprotein GldD
MLCALVLFLCAACMEYSVPKPRAYMRIDIPTARYELFAPVGMPYAFRKSHLATVSYPAADARGTWLTLTYTSLGADVYCHYQRITPRTLPVVTRECMELMHRGVKSAVGISERRYEDVAARVYGVLYCIEGESVSPLQFMLTDSVRHFFRGALYYRGSTQPVDSLLPVTRYLESDLLELIESFEWK